MRRHLAFTLCLRSKNVFTGAFRQMLHEATACWTSAQLANQQVQLAYVETDLVVVLPSQLSPSEKLLNAVIGIGSPTIALI